MRFAYSYYIYIGRNLARVAFDRQIQHVAHLLQSIVHVLLDKVSLYLRITQTFCRKNHYFTLISAKEAQKRQKSR